MNTRRQRLSNFTIHARPMTVRELRLISCFVEHQSKDESCDFADSHGFVCG